MTDNPKRQFPLGKICTDLNQFEKSLNASAARTRVYPISQETINLVKKFESLGGKLDDNLLSIKEIEDFIAKAEQLT